MDDELLNRRARLIRLRPLPCCFIQPMIFDHSLGVDGLNVSDPPCPYCVTRVGLSFFEFDPAPAGRDSAVRPD